MRSTPLPPSFEALRTAVAAQAPMLAPGRPGLRLLLLIALIAVVIGGVYAWRSQPEPEPLAPPPPVSGPSLLTPASALSPQSGSPQSGSPQSGSPQSGSAQSGSLQSGSAQSGSSRPGTLIEVTVHVTGKVRRPGVITLPAGSRVTDAVQAAGGVRKGAATGPLNLARKLVDGEQIIVGAAGPAAAAPPTADPAPIVLDLNTATPEQLEQLPGVGEVLARRIVEYRDGHGGFRTVEQLREVSGIGDRKYAEIREKVHI
ncbi:ComEA family DNA-binding protein [Streptosporangium canum]|uniref:ComEA family DNA-binding protein n=1 Tax=Streptosporangium canum TaxID=324952 RepID=UPI003437FEBD